MNKIIVLAVALAVFLTGVILVKNSKQQAPIEEEPTFSESAQTQDEEVSRDVPIEEKRGRIEGSLSYPSEGIPESLTICAVNISSQDQYCTQNHIKNTKYTYGFGYQLEVPKGKYFVYAFDFENSNYKAYYSEFVTCGLSVDCESHDPIEVVVESEKTTEKIDPSDWYAPNNLVE